VTPEEALFEGLKSLDVKKPTAPTEGSPVEEVMYAKGDPDPSKPVTLRNLFTHPDTHPVVLDFAMLKSFGLDWHRWEPETLFDEVKEVFQTQISELCKHKLRALQVIHASPLVTAKWHVFEKVAHALNGNFPDFEAVQKLSLEELYAAVDILDTLKKGLSYSDEVKLYMAACILDEDIFFVPPPLDLIQVEVSQPYYHCNDCGNEESALFHDGICSNCSDRLHPEQGLSLQPKNKLGRNTTVTVRFDPAPVAKRWEELKGMAYNVFAPKMDDMADVQCGRLLAARDYMNIRRKQLAEQLTALKGWLGAA
jgi:hypothetical protein